LFNNKLVFAFCQTIKHSVFFAFFTFSNFGFKMKFLKKAQTQFLGSILFFSLIFFFLTSFGIFPGKKKKQDPFLYAYHLGDGASGLHLAWSEDGFKWKVLKNGKGFVKPGIGDYVMLDPHLSQSPDGMYHLVWSTGLNRKDLGYAYSKNLIEWSGQRLIPVMEKDSLVLSARSPEMYYDADGQRFMVYWASTVPGKFKDTDKQNDSLPSGYKFNNRIYKKYSSDLRTWGPTEVFFEPGFNVTDASVAIDSGKVMLFFKDATQMGKNIQNNIKMSTSGAATGGFSATPSLVSRRTWAEAPSGIRVDSQFVVYFHKYRTRKMGAMATKDFKKWTDISDSLTFPKGIGAGSIVRVSEKVLEKLKEN
jgi:hypothetical protein